MKFLSLVNELMQYRVTWLGIGAAVSNEFTVNLIKSMI